MRKHYEARECDAYTSMGRTKVHDLRHKTANRPKQRSEMQQSKPSKKQGGSSQHLKNVYEYEIIYIDFQYYISERKCKNN